MEVEPSVVVGVQQAFSRYIHALDRGTVDDCLACFATDAVIEAAPPQGDATGLAAIRTRVQGIIEARNPYMRHLLSTLLVTSSDGSVAEAVVYFDRETMYEADTITDFGHEVEAGTVARHACRYEAMLVNDGGLWRFTRLAIHWSWTDTQRTAITPSILDQE